MSADVGAVCLIAMNTVVRNSRILLLSPTTPGRSGSRNPVVRGPHSAGFAFAAPAAPTDQAVIGMCLGWAATRASHRRIAGHGCRSKPPSDATCV